MARIDEEVKAAEERLAAAKAAYAAWQADLVKTTAYAKACEDAQAASRAREAAQKHLTEVECAVGVRLGITCGEKSRKAPGDVGQYVLTPAFAAALEKEIGWPRVDHKALVPGNNPRSDPWEDAAEAIVQRFIENDPEYKAASSLPVKVSRIDNDCFTVRSDLAREPDRLAREVQNAEQAHREVIKRQSEIKDVKTARVKTTAEEKAEAKALREREAAIKTARKVCQELSEGKRPFPWPPK